MIFRAERGAFPVTWASHLAVTDEAGDRFLYDQRSEVGGQVDRSPAEDGFDLAISGQSLPGVPVPGAVPWAMSGVGGQDHLTATGSSVGTPFGIDLALDAGSRAPVLHDHDGFIDFGAAGGSSTTRAHAWPRAAR